MTTIIVQVGKRTGVLARQWNEYDDTTYAVITKPMPLKATTQALKYFLELPSAEFRNWLHSVGSDVLREELPH